MSPPIVFEEPGTTLVPNWDSDLDDVGPHVDVDLDLEPTPVAPRRIAPVADNSWIRPDSPPNDKFDDNAIGSPIDLGPIDLEPVELGPPVRAKIAPLRSAPRRKPEPEVDLDALRDKYRPKRDAKPSSPPPQKQITKPTKDITKPKQSQPAAPIVLEPIREPTPPIREIKLEPARPIYVEMKRPLKSKYCYFLDKKLSYQITKH